MIATNELAACGSITARNIQRSEDPAFRFSRSTDSTVRASRILVVDDEPAVGSVIKHYLAEVGFTDIRLLSDGALASDYIALTSLDLILLDIHLGNANGLHILQTLREADHLAHTPVIILTQSGDEETKLAALSLGANDFLTKPVAASELSARVRNILSVRAYQEEAIRRSVLQESDVLHDSLTGISNRRAFDFELKRRMSEWQRHKTPVAIMMISVDCFKMMNEQRGQDFADMVLRTIAHTLQRNVREMDLLTRYGGEKFGLILPSTDMNAAIDACRKLQQCVAVTLFEKEGYEIPVTVSVGIANALPDDDAEHLVRRSDMALYAAMQTRYGSAFRHDGVGCVSTERIKGSENQGASCATEASGLGQNLHHAKIAIIDDEPATIAIASQYLLADGFNAFVPVTDSAIAIDTIRRELPDLVLLDLRMPEVDGLEILAMMRSESRLATIPVLVLTASVDKESKVQALNLGATDFLEKPLHPRELIARVHNTLMAKVSLDVLKHYSSRLEHEVSVRTADLTLSRREAIQCLARAAEMRDDVTGRHIIRVGQLAAIISRELGFSEERITWMEHAAQLHDVGKIGIPDSILHKPGQLTDEEFEIMKGHCVAGRSIIRNEVIADEKVKHGSVFDDWTSPMMQLASVVAATHHEKWDGSGYPRGLKGDQIPIEGRITAVADVFDALTSKRAYKPAIPIEHCFLMMQEKRGTHFDPAVLDAFFRRRSEVIRVTTELAD